MVVWDQFPKAFSARNYIKCPDLHKNSCFQPLPQRGGGEVPKYFDRNFMKCPHLHRSHEWNATPVGWGKGQFPKNFFCLELHKMSRYAHKMHVSCLHPTGVG